MSGLSDYTGKNLLNYITGQVAEPALPAVWLALMTAVDTDAGTGGTEVSGGSYVRVQVAGSATTNNTTASGNATLHFASTPSWVVAGMSVTDTSASVIPAATTVLSTTGTTVVMSANATGGGVGNGDTIVFSAFTPATGSAPSTVTNASVVTFPQATASWGTVIAFELRDASSSGNLLAWDYMGNFSWLPATVSAASPGVITAHSHGYSNGDSFQFSTEYGGTAPSFSAGNYTGLQTVAGSATDTFNVTGVNTSATGNGMVRKVTQQSIPINVTASFAASTLTITSA
jgi:hypothetical protein